MTHALNIAVLTAVVIYLAVQLFIAFVVDRGKPWMRSDFPILAAVVLVLAAAIYVLARIV